MKKILYIIFSLSTLVSTAQESFFRGNNNYQAPIIPAEVYKIGLVLNLDAGDPLSYAGSGSTWTDLSGKGNNGIISNSITYSSTNTGSFLFGSNTGIVLPTASNDFNFSNGDFTIEVWAKPASAYGTLLSINTTGGGWSSMRLGPGQADGQISLLQSATASNWDVLVYDSPVGFTWNNWHQVLVSRIANNLTIYIDGVQKITTTSASTLMSNNSGTLNTIGTMTSAGTYGSFNGEMAMVRIYKGIGLTSNQASQNFKAVKSRFSL